MFGKPFPCHLMPWLLHQLNLLIVPSRMGWVLLWIQIQSGWKIISYNAWNLILHEFVYYTAYKHEVIYYVNLCFIQIHIMNLFPYLLCSVYTHVIALCYNPSNTLMKLAKRSKRRNTSFENAAHRQLQTSSLSSKLNVRDDIVSECLYIGNQTFDQEYILNM
jgi:hypothetical protein